MAKIAINKNYSTAVLNFIRCIGLTMTKEIRPIGFSVGTSSTVIEIGDNVEEDMTEFTNNVSSCKFRSDSEEELLVWTGTFNSVLNSTDIKGDVVSLNNKELLHSLGPETVTIYFRNSNGMYTGDENREFLASQGVNLDRVMTISSRHSQIDNYTFKEVERIDDKIVYDVNVSSTYGATFKDLAEKALAELSEVLNS